MVRAKFRLDSYRTTIYSRYPEKKPDGNIDYGKPVKVEMRSLEFSPVSGGSIENKTFWDATPTGKLELGVINPEAWKHFEIGKEYYLDFSLAEE